MSVQSAFSQSFPMPIGCVVNYLGQNVPNSFLLCDGTEYNISDYPYLFNTLKDAYGGDGITTFSVPDLTGEFITGIEQNTNPPTYTLAGGSYSGNFDFGTLSASNLPTNIPLSPTLNSASLTNAFRCKIGYSNGVIKYDGNFHSDNLGNNAGTDAQLWYYTGSSQISATPQWDITATGAFGTFTKTAPSSVTGSISNITGTPPYLALKYIIKAKP